MIAALIVEFFALYCWYQLDTNASSNVLYRICTAILLGQTTATTTLLAWKYLP
jgi:hypothetical protein